MQEGVIKDLADPKIWARCIGKEEHFRNFLKFFEREIADHGYQKVLQKYLVGRNPVATDILSRCYMGNNSISKNTWGMMAYWR